jgi:Ti-type conjugative transfer relaxase TraA
MANYHLHAKTISRGQGRSAVAASAYRRATVMKDERTSVIHYYDNKRGVVHSGLMFPEDAPAWTQAFRDGTHQASCELWNMVERLEKRDNASLAREIEFSLPVELTEEQNIKLAHDYIRDTLVARGMIADWSVHMDDPNNPHVHVMLTMRPLTEDGFGKKKKAVIDQKTGEVKRGEEGEIVYEYGDVWGSKELLVSLRKEWALKQNEYLRAFGHEVMVDHRSFAERGIALEPTMKLGQGGHAMMMRGESSRIVDQVQEVREKNRVRMIANPSLIIDVLSEQKAVFSDADIDAALRRFIPDEGERHVAVQEVMRSDKVVTLAQEHDEVLMTTPAVMRTEQEVIAKAIALSKCRDFAVSEKHVEHAIEKLDNRLLSETNGVAALSEEQKSAIKYVTKAEQFSAVVGMAGAGKTTIMEAARDAWEAQGYRVRGTALSGIAASNLSEAGIASSTLQSFLMHSENAHKMMDSLQGTPLSEKQKNYLSEHMVGTKDVIVLDEAAMVGAAQMHQLLDVVHRSGAKIVMVGDYEQLQSIQAGAAFRTIVERLGKSELSDIRRQQVEWMRVASKDFASERTWQALSAYADRGHVVHVSSYNVQPKPPREVNEELLTKAGMGKEDVERFMRVAEYVSHDKEARAIAHAAQEEGTLLKDHVAYDVYQFYADRRNELAAQFMNEAHDSYRMLRYHDVDVSRLAVHAQQHDGVWLEQAKANADRIVAEKFNPEQLSASQIVVPDEIVHHIKKGFAVPGLSLNAEALSYLEQKVQEAGLSVPEQSYYMRVAEYHEMRVRAAELVSEAQRDGVELKQHEVWDEFIQVKARRDAIVEAIHDDYAGHASYLKHYDLTLEEVAADYLVSQGLSREKAREKARADASSHAELFLRADKGTLNQEVAKSLPNTSLSSAMAQQQLVDDYMAAYAQDEKASRMVLAFTRKDVTALNEAIRQRLIASGHIAPTQNTIRITMQDNEGEYQQSTAFAVGDRVMFRENNKELGVMNGTLGSIKNMDGNSFHVMLDNGKDISFDAKEYTKFQHGYAATVHKAQGVTVDETYVLASKHFDRHSAYVAMTRHRKDVKLYASSHHFRTMDHMKQSLSRSGANRSTLDYTTQALNYVQEQQQRMQSLWERLTIAYHRLRERAELHAKQLQEKVQCHMNKKQEESPEALAERLMQKVHAAADAHPETQDMPVYHRYIMASSFALDNAENEVLPLKERIVNVRTSMQLLREGIDQSPDDLSEAREDMEDMRQRMRGLTFQHVPEPLRNAALRYTSSIELLDEIIQESPEHRHNARVNSSIRRVERDRDNDRDFDD